MRARPPEGSAGGVAAICDVDVVFKLAGDEGTCGEGVECVRTGEMGLAIVVLTSVAFSLTVGV